MSELPKVFLSYSRYNSAEADELDGFLSSIGLYMLRDVRDLGVKSSIKDFMNRVGDSDFVVMLISNEFLHSRSCMYEVLELMRDRGFNKRLFQILVPGADIFNPKYRIDLIKHWEHEKKELEEASKEIPGRSLKNINGIIQLLDNICSSVDDFMHEINEERTIKFAELRTDGYKELLQFLNIGKDQLLTELLEIQDPSNEAETRRRLDLFTREYPHYVRGFFTLAWFQQDLDDKIHFYELGLKLQPQDLHGLWMRAWCAEQKGDKGEALARYNYAIDLHPKEPLLLYNRGIIKHDLDDNKGAIQDYDNAIALDPQNGHFYNNRGNSKRLLGQFKLAIQDFDQALALDPEIPRAHRNKAHCNLRLEDFEEALKNFTSAIKTDPKDEWAYFHRGNIRRHLGDENGGLQDLMKAKKLGISFLKKE